MPFVNELLKYVTNKPFVETGTYQGDTLKIVLNSPGGYSKKIISLELSDTFYNNCKKTFEHNSNVVLFKANSKYDLFNIISLIDSPITFWLDSHWSGVVNVGCDNITICPIIEELQQIKKHPIKTHTIMIDDIRLMNNTSNIYQGFPISLNDIIKNIYEINPNYRIKYYDDDICSNDVLVAYIEN